MKKILLTIAIFAFAAPSYAVVVREPPAGITANTQGTQTNITNVTPTQQTTVISHYPQPAYYENGKPVYVNTPQPPRQHCHDNLGHVIACPPANSGTPAQGTMNKNQTNTQTQY